MTQHIISTCTVVHYTLRYHIQASDHPPPPPLQPPAALAPSWHVFSKALEPECEIKLQLSGQLALLSIKRSRWVTLATLGRKGAACRRTQPWMKQDGTREINRGGGNGKEQLAALCSIIPGRRGPSITLLILCFSIKITAAGS